MIRWAEKFMDQSKMSPERIAEEMDIVEYITSAEFDLERIENTPIMGNAYEDQNFFRAIDDFVRRDDVTREQQKRALRVMDRAMGADTPDDEDEALDEYLTEAGLI